MNITAWELAASPEGQQLLTEARVRVAGGRALWEGAYVSRADKVCLQRLVTAGGSGKFYEIRRYVDADTMLEVVADNR